MHTLFYINKLNHNISTRSIVLLIQCFFISLVSITEAVNAQSYYKNPIIPGFNPDPSICRVGQDYYLVTSSFEYFPGVPIYHSKDLINWEQIGYCLTRKSQLNLDYCPSSGGVWAPTIRYHNGLFYMTTTNVTDKGNFFVTTSDPAGEWSEPIWINQGGIDPTIFFDDDGKTYFTTNAGMNGKYGIVLSEIDIKTGKLLSDIKFLWGGTGGKHPEASHIYKLNGWYYLMIAEGGTEYGHMETIARSKNIWGPYVSNPGNPILTHSGLTGQEIRIQGTGHADMIQAPDNSWWMVFLAFRTYRGSYHNLGRETFLAPLTWNADEWPEVSPGDTVGLKVKANTLPLSPVKQNKVRDEFDHEKPDLCWNFRLNPEVDSWSLTERPGYLRLNGKAPSLSYRLSPTFLGRRQEHFNCTATTSLEFNSANSSEEAGITVLMNEKHHYDLFVHGDACDRKIVLRYQIGNLTHTESELPIPSGPVQLRIAAEPLWYSFSYLPTGTKDFIILGKMDTRYLSSEVAGGFTGVYIGMYATGNGKASSTPADYNWFDYEPLENNK